jgi:hypothetical protein
MIRFFFQRFQRPKLLLGVDFADGQLRIVALRRLKRAAKGHLKQWSPEFELEGYAVAPLPDGAVIAGRIENGPAVSDCVQRLVSKLRMKSRRVAFAVKTSEALLLNTLVATGLSRREKEDRVIALAETALPYSLDEIYLDFAETRGDDSHSGHHSYDQTAERITDNDQIVIVAAQLEAIDSRVAVCRDAGLDVEVADPEASSFALGYARDSGLIELELSALESSGNGEVIARPKVTTQDKMPALIQSGVRIPYQAQAGGAAGGSITQFEEAVLSLEVTPQITPDGRINMQLDIRQDSVAPGNSLIPAINTNQVTTRALVNDGETIALGGVFREETSVTESKTPILGDLPYVGRLFKRSNRSSRRTELLIFITPKILDELPR